MHAAPVDFISLDAFVPTRWTIGEPRLVKLRLWNVSHSDLKHVRLRTSWSDTVPTEEQWQKVGYLRRESTAELSLTIQAPQAREDQFKVQVTAEMGDFLKLEFVSAQMDVHARAPLQPDGGVRVSFENSGIQGDKLAYGQMVAEGGLGIGHVVNVHGGSTHRDHLQWLDADPAAGKMQSLPLFISQEVCHTWTNPRGMTLCGIHKGEFVMGATHDDAEALPEEKVRHDVIISRSFWMGAHPVTMAQYAEVMKVTPPVSYESHKGDKMPVGCVSWMDAKAYCEQLTRLESAAGSLPPGYVYRLPTEAEWEYACRGGIHHPRYGDLEKIGAVKKNCGGFGNVGRFAPNPWGLYDMLGLVFEWCLDAHAPYKLMETTDPVNLKAEPGKELRVIRGGCYQGPDQFARASARFGQDPKTVSHRVGFRVVLAREV